MKLDMTAVISFGHSNRSHETASFETQTSSAYHWVMKYWKLHMLRLKVRRERKVLAKLSHRELADIGVNRAQALKESRRAYTDIPQERNY